MNFKLDLLFFEQFIKLEWNYLENKESIVFNKWKNLFINFDNVYSINLEEVVNDVISERVHNDLELMNVDELLFISDILYCDDFKILCKKLFIFIQNEADNYAMKITKSDSNLSKLTDTDQRIIRVWFATNRDYSAHTGISEEVDSTSLTYGLCNVFIPKSHKPGSTGTPWWRRWIRLEKDDSLKVEEIFPISHDVFWDNMRNKFSRWWKQGERNIFVLIHGFNVSFEEAATSAAQIGYDLKLPGEIAFYSWPSRGNIASYLADEATISASTEYIAQFLRELSEKSGAERIHLFVHSMGSRGFISALERLVAKGASNITLGQIFFCAPDEDVRTFRDKTSKFPHTYENRTLYVSGEDKAVALSKWLHDHDRVGIIPPVLNYPDIETIQVNGFGIIKLGHGYFASAEPIINDIREAIETKKKATERKLPMAVENYFTIDL
jgi:esterase/lipase superfamily enzyme